MKWLLCATLCWLALCQYALGIAKFAETEGTESSVSFGDQCSNINDNQEQVSYVYFREKDRSYAGSGRLLTATVKDDCTISWSAGQSEDVVLILSKRFEDNSIQSCFRYISDIVRQLQSESEHVKGLMIPMKLSSFTPGNIQVELWYHVFEDTADLTIPAVAVNHNYGAEVIACAVSNTNVTASLYPNPGPYDRFFTTPLPTILKAVFGVVYLAILALECFYFYGHVRKDMQMKRGPSQIQLCGVIFCTLYFIQEMLLLSNVYYVSRVVSLCIKWIAFSIGLQAYLMLVLEWVCLVTSVRSRSRIIKFKLPATIIMAVVMILLAIIQCLTFSLPAFLTLQILRTMMFAFISLTCFLVALAIVASGIPVMFMLSKTLKFQRRLSQTNSHENPAMKTLHLKVTILVVCASLVFVGIGSYLLIIFGLTLKKELSTGFAQRILQNVLFMSLTLLQTYAIAPMRQSSRPASSDTPRVEGAASPRTASMAEVQSKDGNASKRNSLTAIPLILNSNVRRSSNNFTNSTISESEEETPTSSRDQLHTAGLTSEELTSMDNLA